MSTDSSLFQIGTRVQTTHGPGVVYKLGKKEFGGFCAVRLDNGEIVTAWLDELIRIVPKKEN